MDMNILISSVDLDSDSQEERNTTQLGLCSRLETSDALMGLWLLYQFSQEAAIQVGSRAS